ncbi:hypothetical protein D3C86_1793960 [compost metagenome]
MGKGFAGVDALAATDSQDHVELDGSGGASQLGDAVCGDLAIEGDVVQLDVCLGAGVIESRPDQTQYIAVDDHQGLATAMRQIRPRLSEHFSALDVSSGRTENQIHSVPHFTAYCYSRHRRQVAECSILL